MNATIYGYHNFWRVDQRISKSGGGKSFPQHKGNQKKLDILFITFELKKYNKWLCLL